MYQLAGVDQENVVVNIDSSFYGQLFKRKYYNLNSEKMGAHT